MKQRPQRNNNLPLIEVAADTLADLRRAIRLIYAGAIADGRAIDAAQGVYTVKVKEPLEVTDEGIVINFHDNRWRALLRVRCSDDTPAVVDPLQADGEAGTDGVPARGDHRHAHAELPENEEDLEFSYDLTLADGADWDPETQTLTLERSDYAFKRDAAGHAKWTPDLPDDNPDSEQLTGLVCEIIDGASNQVKPCDRIKFVAGTGINVVVADDNGPLEDYKGKVTIAATVTNTDEKVRVSANDDSADYLVNKVVGDGAWLLAEEVNDPNEEDLKIKHIGPDASSVTTVSFLEDGGAQVDVLIDDCGHIVEFKGQSI